MYITYKDLETEQARDLDYKIETFVTAVRSAARVRRHRMALAFSAGKDSTVLWDAIRRFVPEILPYLVIIYGNTGIEYAECVRFARQLKVVLTCFIRTTIWPCSAELTPASGWRS